MHWDSACVRGAKARADLGLSGLTAAADELRQRWNERLPRDVQTAAQIIPESHAMLCAGFGKAEEGIPAIASAVAARPGTDLAADHLTADVVFRAVGVKRYLRPVQHHISSSDLLACSRFSNRSSVANPVRRRKMRSNRARSTTRWFLLGLARYILRSA